MWRRRGRSRPRERRLRQHRSGRADARRGRRPGLVPGLVGDFPEHHAAHVRAPVRRARRARPRRHRPCQPCVQGHGGAGRGGGADGPAAADRTRGARGRGAAGAGQRAGAGAAVRAGAQRCRRQHCRLRRRRRGGAMSAQPPVQHDDGSAGLGVDTATGIAVGRGAVGAIPGRRRNPLRWTGLPAGRATAAIGAVILLLLCATALSAWILRVHEIEDWRQDLAILTLVLAENTAQTMTSTYLTLDSLAETARPARGERAVLASVAMQQTLHDKLAGQPQIAGAALVDAAGDMINHSRVYPAPAINLADRDYFIHHRDHPGSAAFLSRPVRNKRDGKWTFFVSRRLDDGAGRFAGVVLVGVSCDFFADFFRNVSLGDHATITLYQSDYTLLARWPLMEPLMGQRVTGGATHEVLSSGQDSAVVLTDTPRASDGRRAVFRMGAVRRVRNYPLIINATITE